MILLIELLEVLIVVILILLFINDSMFQKKKNPKRGLIRISLNSNGFQVLSLLFNQTHHSEKANKRKT